MSIDRLCKRLGYRFSDASLLEQALTHRSFDATHYERLEFLGDAVLSFLIADKLYTKFHNAREGALTHFRASLVRKESLAELARELELGHSLRLGGGELKSGGRERDSILADALEALFGAIYLDGGVDECRRVLSELYDKRIDALSPGSSQKDPKTRLQEWLQSHRIPLPEYKVESVEGSDHNQRFTATCRIDSLPEPTLGHGGSRRKAEQEAAEAALAKLILV